MTYFDASNTIEIQPISETDFYQRLVIAFNSLEIKTNFGEGGTLEFQVPIVKTGSRGFRLKGISSGIVSVMKLDDKTIVSYNLIMILARLYSWVTFPLFVIAVVAYSVIAYRAFHIILFGFLMIMVDGYAYVVSRSLVSRKFASFIRVMASR